MKSESKSAMQRMIHGTIMVVLLAAACGQSVTSTNTPTIKDTTPEIIQVGHDLPRVWLIIDNRQLEGTLAAGGSTQGHFDPALTLPNIKTANWPADARPVIAIDSSSVQALTVTVRPWTRDGRIIPLADSSVRQLKIVAENISNAQAMGVTTTITFEAIANVDDQLLNVNVTFKDEWGFYLWRLNPQP